MKFYSVFFILGIFTSCISSKPEYHEITVTKYFKVGEGYSYSSDLLKYNGTVYRPIITAVYVKDSLTGAAVYKPEGKIDYSVKELNEDTLLKRSLGLPEIRKITVTEKEVVDNDRRYAVHEQKSDSIFCIASDTLLLYKVH